MKRLFFLLALLPYFAVAQSLTLFPSPQQHVAAAGGPTLLLSENFEGTGTPSGWTDRAPIDYDYATTGWAAGMEGSQCMIAGTDGGTTTASFAGQSELYVDFLVIWTNSTSADANNVRIQNGSSADVVELWTSSAGGTLRPYVKCGTASSGQTGEVSLNTVYVCRLHYIKGTGSDGVASVEFSTTGTFSGSGSLFASVTTGTATTDATKLFFYTDNASLRTWIIDRLKVWPSDPGNDPPP